MDGIGCLEVEDRLVIGEKYLVALDADVLRVERRPAFEQHPDGVTHPGFDSGPLNYKQRQERHRMNYGVKSGKSRMSAGLAGATIRMR
jgi:hypothetical protein